MSNYKKIFKRIFAVLIAVALAVPMFTTGLVKAEKTEEYKVGDQTLHVYKIIQANGLKELTTKDNRNTYVRDGITIKDSDKAAEGVYFEVFKAKYTKEELNKPENAGKDLEYDAGEAAAEGITKKQDDGDIYAILKFAKDAPNGDYILVENYKKSNYKDDGGGTLGKHLAVPQRITLPIVDDKGLVEPAKLYPKNMVTEKPVIDKQSSIEAETSKPAGVSLGDKVTYTITTTIQPNTHYNTLAWSDTMTKGLTLNKKDTFIEDNLKITKVSNLGELTVDNIKNYIEKVDTSDRGFVIKLNAEALKIINDENKRTQEGVIEFTYDATVNKDAVVDFPEENSASLFYGNAPFTDIRIGDNTPVPQNPTPGKGEDDATIKVKKVWEGKDEDKKEVTFTLEEYDPTTGKYEDVKGKEVIISKDGPYEGTFTGLKKNGIYKVVENFDEKSGYISNYSVDNQGNLTVKNRKTDNPTPQPPKIVTLQTGGKKFKKVDGTNEKEVLDGARFVFLDSDGENFLAVKDNGEYTWRPLKEKDNFKDPDTTVTIDGTTDKAVIKESGKEGEKGTFEIKGLKAGKYKIMEIKAPSDYQRPATNIKEFEIKAGMFDNSDELGTIPNDKSKIPETGGIGSIIFVVAGVALMGLAVYTINKKRKTN